MKRPTLCILGLLLAAPALADGPMTAAEFEAYTQGKTLTFGAASDKIYGAEQYQPNRRVVWSYLNGTCDNGVWYESKGSICFRYDSDPEPQCWTFYDQPDGLRAIYMNRPNTSLLYEAEISTKPLTCPAPYVGS